MTVALGGKTMTLPAEGDLSSTGQFRFATVDADGRGALAGGNSEVLVGIGQNKPAAIDRGWAVQIDGTSKLLLAGSVNEGDRLTSNATGEGLATTTVSHTVGAIALEAGGDGDYITVQVIPGSFGA